MYNTVLYIYIYKMCVRVCVLYTTSATTATATTISRPSILLSSPSRGGREEGNHCVRTTAAEAIGCERRRRRRPFKAFTPPSPPPRTCVRLLYDERRLIVRARPIVAGDDVSPLMTTLINNIRGASSFLDCACAKISGTYAPVTYIIMFYSAIAQ